jgi:Spy/CpxP family protein refolding chaperone
LIDHEILRFPETEQDKRGTSLMKPRDATMVLVLCCFGLAVATFAQGGGRRMPGGSGSLAGSNSTASSPGNSSNDPREQAIWRAAAQLDLTVDQRSQLGAALKAGRADRSALDKSLQDASHALADALANGETFLDSYIENLTSANAKVQESDLKLWAKLYSVLTPDQQRRMLTLATPLSQAGGSHLTSQTQ